MCVEFLDLLSLVMRVFFHSGIERASFLGEFISCFRKGKGKSVHPLVPAVFQEPVVQSNPYASTAYLTVAHSAPFHYLEMSVRHSSEGAVYVSIIPRSRLNDGNLQFISFVLMTWKAWNWSKSPRESMGSTRR